MLRCSRVALASSSCLQTATNCRAALTTHDIFIFLQLCLRTGCTHCGALLTETRAGQCHARRPLLQPNNADLDCFLQITVVDSHTFIKEYGDRNPVATRPDLGGDDSAFRPVVDLLVEQVEVCSLNCNLAQFYLHALLRCVRLCCCCACSRNMARTFSLSGASTEVGLAQRSGLL